MCVHVAESMSQSLYRYLACKTDDPDVMLWLCIRSPGVWLSGCALGYSAAHSQNVTKISLQFKKFMMAFWDVLFEDEQNIFQFQDWVVTFGAALVLPIVLKLCSNKAQFISMLNLVGINFIILKILTLCFFINIIYLYFYFQYLSTFNVRKLLLILKYSKDQIL